MEHREYEPPEELRDMIKCFWYTRMDFGPEQSSYEVVPDGYAEITFHFGCECSIAYNGQLQPLPSPFIMGLLNQPAVFHTKGIFEVIGVRCFPWTVFDLLGLTAGTGEQKVLEHPIAGLQPVLDGLIKAGKVDAAVAAVMAYFVNGKTGGVGNNILSKAGVAMTDANGAIPVSMVAAAAHTSVRTLERKFKQASGHSVKDVSGLMRFERVRNHLWLHPEASLAGLAAELGYADQSHLSREFKRYSGSTPAAFAKKAKERVVHMDFVGFAEKG